MKYKHLSYSDRQEMEKLYLQGWHMNDIAAKLGVSLATVYHERARGDTGKMQRDWFTDDFCQPIYEEWFAEAVARGRIAAPGFFADPAIRKAYTACAWNGPARTNLNPVQEVDAAVKRVDAGFSTAQEETATMTGGDYNRNIRQRVIEAKRKREVDEITNPQAKPPGGQQEE